ncbi:MAG: OmpH family outer membrane protein [Marinifilaceae bacterium]|jgi:outer membrane protein|nr:OmpH family outer membrane protein [Marinifilaceae bacterium]
MNKTSQILNGIIIVALVVLYVLFFNQKKNVVEPVKAVAGSESVVYMNIDSLLLNYNMAKDLNEAFLKKQEERRTNLNIKAKALEKEAIALQTKIKNHGFITQARENQAQRDFMIKRNKLQKLQEEYGLKAQSEQAEMNKKLYDKIMSYLKVYNKQKGYDIILSTTKGGTVFYAKQGYNITNDVLKGLNKGYKK